jgi:hypothetical protein
MLEQRFTDMYVCMHIFIHAHIYSRFQNGETCMHAACSTEVSCVKLMYRLKDARTMLCHQSNVSLAMILWP